MLFNFDGDTFTEYSPQLDKIFGCNANEITIYCSLYDLKTGKNHASSLNFKGTNTEKFHPQKFLNSYETKYEIMMDLETLAVSHKNSKSGSLSIHLFTIPELKFIKKINLDKVKNQFDLSAISTSPRSSQSRLLESASSPKKSKKDIFNLVYSPHTKLLSFQLNNSQVGVMKFGYKSPRNKPKKNKIGAGLSDSFTPQLYELNPEIEKVVRIGKYLFEAYLVKYTDKDKPIGIYLNKKAGYQSEMQKLSGMGLVRRWGRTIKSRRRRRRRGVIAIGQSKKSTS